MATLLDAPKPPNTAKVEEFVEKQLLAARRRVRLLDYFMAGLSLAIVSMAFLVGVLLVDRYVETPRGAGWAVVAGYLALAAGFLYLALFRPSRRQINPYFAARQVELNVPNSKNSIVTWVDFEEDSKLPGSIKTAIGQKAARDLKGVDLNRAIENRKIIWLAIGAGLFLLANVVIAFLPPTRTELTLEEPKKGDVTVFSNQDVTFQVRVHARIPNPNDADAVRLRLWYNPDDPESYEERPMQPSEGDRRLFAVTVPAKQVRDGFRYKILGGNSETPTYTVTCKIIPEFRGFEVSYQYPDYLKRPPETNNDSNLLAPYGTVATMVVSTNRDVKHGHIEIEGQTRTIDGQLIEGRPDALLFTLTLEKEGFFRVWFTTTEGDKNHDPARLRLGVIDPKPTFRTFTLDYKYPAYLRHDPMSAPDMREPEIEGPRGTEVTITAKTTRGVKDAKLELGGHPPIMGEPVPDQPMWVRFKLPPIDQDGTARVSFTPTTSETPSPPREIPIRALIDQAPTVEFLDPKGKKDDAKKDDVREVLANGTLDLAGLATDDHGVDKLVLRMTLIGAEDRDLVSKPYRGGMSFHRKGDNSWPTRVEYKDFIKLPELRMERNPNWRVGPGMEVEYWLEATDNCTVPRPNVGMSQKKRFKVLAPKPPEQKNIEQENKKREKEQQAHEKKQDDKNKAENRDVKQDPPKGAEGQPKDGHQQGEPKGADQGPMPRNADGTPGSSENPQGMPPQDANPDHERQTDEVKRVIEQAKQDSKISDNKPDMRPPADAKVDPSGERPPPKADATGTPQSDTKPPPKAENMEPMGGGTPGEQRTGKVDNTPQEKGSDKGKGDPMSDTPPDGDHKPSYGGASENASGAKPDAKDPPAPKNGGADTPKTPPEKGTARKEPSKSKEPKGPGDSTAPGAVKPETETTASADKKPSGEPGKTGDTPPDSAGATKPLQRPDAGGTRPEPKKDQVTDAGGSRTGPKDENPAGDNQPPPKKNATGDEQATGESRGGGQGSPQQKNQKPGELSREHGELAREINSANPEVSDQAKEDVDRLMRNPQTRQETRDELDKLERNAKDELSRKKARELRDRGEQAAKNYDQERPNPENVDTLSKKLGSKDERERKEAEQRAKDWENNAQTKKELEEEVERLKKKDPAAADRVKDAMNRSEQARNGNTGETPKLDENQLKNMAQDLNGSDQKAKSDAERKLQQMAKDQKSAKDAQDQLQAMADKAPEGSKEKQDLQNAANQAGKMAKEMAKKEPTPKGGSKIDPKDLENAAKQLASMDPKEREKAMEQMKEMMKDPKSREQAQEMLKDMANNAKTPEDKQALENAMKQADQLAREMKDNQTPKIDPKDIKDLANKMAGKDEKAKEEARRKFEEMMKDPKMREKAREMMEQMAKDGKNTPEETEALKEAMKQAAEMAKKDPPPKIDPKNMNELAKEFGKLDPKAQEELKKKFEEAMKDEKFREEMKKKAEEMAKNSTPEQKKQFNDMMRQLAGGDYDYQSKPDPSDPRHKLQAAELLLEEFKEKIKDKKFLEELNWTEEQKLQWMKDQEAAIAALRKQAEKGDWRATREGRSPIGRGMEKIDLGKKDGNDPRGPRAPAPPGYSDPYKRFTGGQTTEPKR